MERNARNQVIVTALSGIPLIMPGDDLAGLIVASVRSLGLKLETNDILVIAQKVVSKAEGRLVKLADVVPSERASLLAPVVGKDPRFVEVVLRESTDVVRCGPNVLVVEHTTGHVMANAGVDQSNVDHSDGEALLLLPRDPDRSCAALKATFDRTFGVGVGVIINDSFGRPLRNGVVGTAIGSAGIPSIKSMVGAPDLFGRSLRLTEIAWGDELASMASLLMGQADEGSPVVLIRGFELKGQPIAASALPRSKGHDLFRQSSMTGAEW